MIYRIFWVGPDGDIQPQEHGLDLRWPSQGYTGPITLSEALDLRVIRNGGQ